MDDFENSITSSIFSSRRILLSLSLNFFPRVDNDVQSFLVPAP